MKRTIVGIMAVGALAVSAHGYVIDTFDTDQMVMATSAGTVANAINAPEAIGGERELIARNIVGGGALSEVVNMTTAGKLDFSLDVGTIGQGKIVYDGDDNADGAISDSSPNSTGLSGIDITDGGVNTKLAVAVCIADFPVDVYFKIWDTSGANSTYTFNLPGGIISETVYQADLASFSGAADFTDVGAVKVLITPSLTNTDISFDYFQTVPAPGALAMVGVAGLLGTRRRRR